MIEGAREAVKISCVRVCASIIASVQLLISNFLAYSLFCPLWGRHLNPAAAAAAAAAAVAAAKSWPLFSFYVSLHSAFKRNSRIIQKRMQEIEKGRTAQDSWASENSQYIYIYIYIFNVGNELRNYQSPPRAINNLLQSK